VSDAIRCDRCGCYQDGVFIASGIQRDDGAWRSLFAGLRFRFKEHGGYRGRAKWETVHLCTECSRDLDRFMENQVSIEPHAVTQQPRHPILDWRARIEPRAAVEHSETGGTE